jgi:hypothetical protein
MKTQAVVLLWHMNCIARRSQNKGQKLCTQEWIVEFPSFCDCTNTHLAFQSPSIYYSYPVGSGGDFFGARSWPHLNQYWGRKLGGGLYHHSQYNSWHCAQLIKHKHNFTFGVGGDSKVSDDSILIWTLHLGLHCFSPLSSLSELRTEYFENRICFCTRECVVR